MEFLNGRKNGDQGAIGFALALRGLFLLIAVGLFVPAGVVPARAQGLVADEDGLRAAFLLNFARFVQWPDQAEQGLPFCIGVLADRRLADAAQQSLSHKSLRGRPLEVKYFASPRELQACPIVFIGSTNDEDSRAALEALAGAPVLTVGEGRRFLDLGGVIALVQSGRRIQFEINAAAGKRQNLCIGSDLLRLARTIHDRD